MIYEHLDHGRFSRVGDSDKGDELWETILSCLNGLQAAHQRRIATVVIKIWPPRNISRDAYQHTFS